MSEENEVILKYFKDLLINWRCLQRMPVGGTLNLVKDELNKHVLFVLTDFLKNFEIGTDTYKYMGTIIKLI